MLWLGRIWDARLSVPTSSSTSLAGLHQQMTWSRCASSWTQGRAHLAWGQQETPVPLSQRDFDDFCISVSPSCCPTPMHTNRNQLQRNMRLKASKNSLACTQTYFICLIKQRSCPWWITDIQLSGWNKNAQKSTLSWIYFAQSQMEGFTWLWAYLTAFQPSLFLFCSFPPPPHQF